LPIRIIKGVLLSPLVAVYLAFGFIFVVIPKWLRRTVFPFLTRTAIALIKAIANAISRTVEKVNAAIFRPIGTFVSAKYTMASQFVSVRYTRASQWTRTVLAPKIDRFVQTCVVQPSRRLSAWIHVHAVIPAKQFIRATGAAATRAGVRFWAWLVRMETRFLAALAAFSTYARAKLTAAGVATGAFIKTRIEPVVMHLVFDVYPAFEWRLIGSIAYICSAVHSRLFGGGRLKRMVLALGGAAVGVYSAARRAEAALLAFLARQATSVSARLKAAAIRAGTAAARIAQCARCEKRQSTQRGRI
jgi:hypothetical protein